MNNNWLNGWSRRKAVLFALLVYSVLSVIMTWPLAAQLGTHFPGQDTDTWSHVWTFWWVKKAIADGLNPFFTNLLYFPQGVSLTAHNIAWFHISLWLPLQAIFGGIAAYNLIFIATFSLNALAMYLLVVEWTDSPPAALVGGLIFGFWPDVVSQASRPNLIAIFWLPLALLFLKRTMDRGRIMDAVLMAFFVAMIGITRWQLLIMAMPILGLFVVYQITVDHSLLTQRTATRLGLAGLLGLVLMAPLGAPVIVGQLTRDDSEEIFDELSSSRASDLMPYVVPNSNLSVLGQVVSRLPERLRFTTSRIGFIGYTALVLATIGAVTNWRLARFWVLLAAFIVLMALGTQLIVAGQAFPQVPMPYRLVDEWFIFRVLRNPQRFNVFLGLPVGMLAAIGTASLLNRSAFRQRAAVVVGMAGLLILIEYAVVPFRTMPPIVPEWYQRLAAEPGNFGVLGLPLEPTNADKWYMMYQITHGKPLVEGHVSRRPRDAYAFLDSTPFLSHLRAKNVMDAELVDVSRQLRKLAEAGIPYLILHKGFAEPEQMTNWREWLGVEPAYEDSELAVYHTDLHLGRDFEMPQMLTKEVGLIDANFAPNEVDQTGSVEFTALWGSSGRPDGDYDACVQLVDAEGQIALTDCRLLASYWPTTRWEANEVVRSQGHLTVDPFWEPGKYQVILALVESKSGHPVGHKITLGELIVRPLPRVFEDPAPDRLVEARWNSQFSLPGYDLSITTDELQLTLYWQALNRSDKSYKVFVHLIEEATGIVAAQNDAIPRQWTYPTTLWEKGEYVEDTITLTLVDLPSGRYRLLVGFYDEDSGQRMPAYSAEGVLFAGDSVPLTSVQIE